MQSLNRTVERPRRAIDVFKTWLPRVALAIVFVLFGALKFAAHSMYVRIFDEIGLGQWFRYFTGVTEIAGAVLLLIPRAAFIGFILLGCTMAGAVSFWIFNHNPFAALIPGTLLLAIIGFGGAEVVRRVASARRRPS
jgi:putative oxidoreductase